MNKKNLFLLILVIGVALIFFVLSDKSSDTADNTEINGDDKNEMNGEASVKELILDESKYSFDFEGATKIVVQYMDGSTNGEPLRQDTILDENTISTISTLLNELPEDGELERTFSSGLVTTIAAYKENELLSYVQFYRTALRAENGNYYNREDKSVDQKESQLYSLVAELSQN